jgi:hypothetical protein
MTATNTTPRVRQRSQNGDDGLEQHKGPVEGGSPGLWLRSSVGWSGARSWVSRHPTRSFMHTDKTIDQCGENVRKPAPRPHIIQLVSSFPSAPL